MFASCFFFSGPWTKSFHLIDPCRSFFPQGTILDRIDYNVEQAAVKVEEGLEQLRKVSTNILLEEAVVFSKTVFKFLWFSLICSF